MSDSRFAGTPDTLDRKVLFALELVDPGSLRLVDRGVTVRAEGLAGRPIVSRSGRFVWLMEGDAWPGPIAVTPDGAAFVAQVVPAPPRPADIEHATPDERLVRVVLRPNVAYPFDDGVTLVRGRLRQSTASDAPRIVGARVQLAWLAENHRWYPDPGDVATFPGETLTDGAGEFVVFVRLAPRKGLAPDIDDRGQLRARLQVTPPGEDSATRVTPADYAFLDPVVGEPSNAGRLLEGRTLARDLDLALDQMTPP